MRNEVKGFMGLGDEFVKGLRKPKKWTPPKTVRKKTGKRSDHHNYFRRLMRNVRKQKSRRGSLA